MTNASINAAVSTSSSGWVGWSQVACNVALPTITTLGADGVAYMQIYQMRMGLSGKDASRTVQLAIWNTSNSRLANTANFTVAAATSAGQTFYQALTTPLLVNRTTTANLKMGFWVSGNGAVYYQRDDSGQTTEIDYDTGSSSSATTFTGAGVLDANSSLVGAYGYYTQPSAPASISLTAGQGQVTVNWTAPTNDGGTPILRYTLQRATDSGFTTNLVSTTGLTGTSTTVTGLTNGTPYYFRIYAVNAVSVDASIGGAWKVAASSVTPSASATVPGIPTFPIAAQQTVQTPTGLKLSWTAPASNGGSAITQYSIKYSNLLANLSSATPVLTGSTAVTANINSLLSGATYYFQVAAVNAVGTGAYSDIVSATTYTPATGSNGVIKRWDATLAQWVIIV
jgi:Fibronectin type III domain